MQKILFLKGLQASGKTTYANELAAKDSNWVIICKDDIRKELGVSGGGKSEKSVIKRRNELAEMALQAGKSIISADTNFNPIHEKYFRSLAVKYNCEFEEKFFPILVQDAIKRDLMRENPVGKDAILYTWYKYIVPTTKVYQYNPELPDCIICDLDGTLCLFGDKNPYERDFTMDNVSIPVRFLVNQSHKNNLKVFLFSGRKSEFRQETEFWLDINSVHYHKLHMRDIDDNRKDDEVKLDFYMENIHEKYNPIFVIDDRKIVKRLWVALGLFVFDVNQGDFEY